MILIKFKHILNKTWPFVFLFLQLSTTLTIYNNAKFTPVDDYFTFANLSLVAGRNICACHCFYHPMCLIATYSGLSNSCNLSAARFDQGTLQISTTDQINSIFVFENKILPGLFIHRDNS